jgi:2-methylcitrate dehydratase PrpD
MNYQAKIETAGAAATASIQAQLADFAVSLGHDDIPAEVRTRAVHHMLDAAGIAVASTRYDFAHKTLAGVRALSSEGRVPVFGMPARLPARDAAIMNGYLAHGLDYDDTHIAGIVHPTSSALPATLSAAQLGGANGRDMVTAFIIGIEAAARLGMTAKSQFHQVGHHPTGMIGVFGAALAAGRLMGLNKAALIDAQGIALSMASGSLQFLEDGAWNKRLHPGWAAQAGIMAASLAREGFKGASDPYDGRFGVFNSYLGCGPRTAELDFSLATAGLGETWELMATAIKPFPTCHFTHGAIDAALELRSEVGDPAAIESILIKVPQGVHKTICEPEENKFAPQNDYDAKFSVQFLVAAALVRGKLTLAELEPDALGDETILALTRRVSFADDPDSPFPAAYSGEVLIKTTDGREFLHREHINRGAANRPLTNDEIVEKWVDNAQMTFGPDRVRDLQAAVLGLDQAPSALAAFDGFATA